MPPKLTTHQLRQKYLDFFQNRGHAVIPPAPLIPQDDPTTLFTSSGMQPLVSYLLGQPHPSGSRLVNSQPCIRVQDIDEVGDNRHTTFFEMLGNWSLGDYFKKEQLGWFFQFLTDPKEGLGLDPHRLYVTIFAGNDSVPKDHQSIKIWQQIFNQVGISAQEGDRVRAYPAEKNWWSRSGPPSQMPSGEIGGPDSEVFYDFGTELQLHQKSPFKNQPCHPNCDCGRFLEIGNSVFIQYQKQPDGSLKELPQKNVDFGGGFERLLSVSNSSPDIFRTELFWPLIEILIKQSGKDYASEFQPAMRVIADHLKAATFLAAQGLKPANKHQGYVMRRLVRRAVVKLRQLGVSDYSQVSQQLVDQANHIYGSVYPEVKDVKCISSVIAQEVAKFKTTLHRGFKKLEKHPQISPRLAFDLFQTYGFPFEITQEIAAEKGQKLDKQAFDAEFQKHQQLSRTASAGMFKSGLADHSQIVTRYHTATHLLLAALRRILGDHVQQKGSNITAARLRFDFSHPAKLTEEQIRQVQDLVNQKIQEDLPVSFAAVSYQQAINQGAQAAFGERYPRKVTVYTIGDPQKSWFSKEICAGPHVKFTGEVGAMEIYKQKSASAGVRRIYARSRR